MIKDLNGLTVLMLVVTILAAIFLAWLYTKPGKKWLMSYDTVGGVPYCGSWHTISLFSVQQIIILMLLPAFFTLAFKSPIR